MGEREGNGNQHDSGQRELELSTFEDWFDEGG